MAALNGTTAEAVASIRAAGYPVVVMPGRDLQPDSLQQARLQPSGPRQLPPCRLAPNPTCWCTPGC